MTETKILNALVEYWDYLDTTPIFEPWEFYLAHTNFEVFICLCAKSDRKILSLLEKSQKMHRDKYNSKLFKAVTSGNL